MIVSVSFGYHGPYCGILTDEPSPAVDNALEAERQVERALKASGLPFVHAYSWPDGSLYKWVEVGDLTPTAVQAKITDALKATEARADITVQHVTIERAGRWLQEAQRRFTNDGVIPK